MALFCIWVFPVAPGGLYGSKTGSGVLSWSAAIQWAIMEACISTHSRVIPHMCWLYSLFRCLGGPLVHLGVSCDPGGVYTGLKRGPEYSQGQQQSKEPSWRLVSPLIHELYPHICWLYSLLWVPLWAITSDKVCRPPTKFVGPRQKQSEVYNGP